MSELVGTRLATLEEKVAVLASQNAALQTEVLHLRAAVADSGKVRKNEDYYQSLLSARMNAGHMSITGVGTTDITTADAHIEIKKWSGYHEVIGQLAKYNRAVKRPRLCVYFFGPEPKKERYEQILDLMTEANIEMYSFDASDETRRHLPAVPQVSKLEDAVRLYVATELKEDVGHGIKWTQMDELFRVWLQKHDSTIVVPLRKVLRLSFESAIGVEADQWNTKHCGHISKGWKNLRFVNS
jgi:hypothetical protein